MVRPCTTSDATGSVRARTRLRRSRFALAAVRGACPAPQRFSADSNADYKVTNTSATAVTARGGAVNLVVMERRLACLLFAAALAGVAGAGEPARAATTPTLKEAIARGERETAGKVLSAETRRAGKQTIYRIKVLTRDGKVKNVEVDAED